MAIAGGTAPSPMPASTSPTVIVTAAAAVPLPTRAAADAVTESALEVFESELDGLGTRRLLDANLDLYPFASRATRARFFSCDVARKFVNISAYMGVVPKCH